MSHLMPVGGSRAPSEVQLVPVQGHILLVTFVSKSEASLTVISF